MALLFFGILIPWTVVGIGCWIAFQLVRQNGRVLLRMEALEQRLSQLQASALQGRPAPSPQAAAPAPAPSRPPGLPVGSPAPDFELPDLTGARRSLSDWRGRRLLLVFFNPQCGFCTQMAPDLAILSPEANGHQQPMPLIVSTGDAAQNRQLVQQHGIRSPYLLQQQMEVAAQYQVGGTPMGYLIDEAGTIASDIAVGSRALLDLVKTPSGGAAHEGGEHVEHKGNRTLADSHINRSGLSAGTPAPGFLLPRVGGGKLALEQYRGQRVVLVFSDPNCGPCDALGPKLEELHRERPDLQVLMISRGTVEANRQKMKQSGATFPVVLQEAWEISRAYGTFATPVGYLIDKQGVIAAEVAVGPDAIVALASVPAGVAAVAQ